MSIFIEQVQKVILENNIQDYFEDNFIDDLVVYVEFLDNILNEDIDEVATKFVKLVLDYYDSQTRYRNPIPSNARKLYKRKYNEELSIGAYFKSMQNDAENNIRIKKSTGEDIMKSSFSDNHRLHNSKSNKFYNPSRAIKEDIKIAEKFRDLLLQISMSVKKENKNRIWGNPVNGVFEAFELTEKLIDDLKNKKFEVVRRSVYYDDWTKPSKTEIRNFIKQVVKTYKINTTDLSINQLIEKI